MWANHLNSGRYSISPKQQKFCKNATTMKHPLLSHTDLYNSKPAYLYDWACTVQVQYSTLLIEMGCCRPEHLTKEYVSLLTVRDSTWMSAMPLHSVDNQQWTTSHLTKWIGQHGTQPSDLLDFGILSDCKWLKCNNFGCLDTSTLPSAVLRHFVEWSPRLFNRAIIIRTMVQFYKLLLDYYLSNHFTLP